MIRTHVASIHGVQETNSWNIQLRVIVPEQLPKVGHGAAIGKLFCGVGRSRPLPENGEELDSNFHRPWSCETMWRISGKMSFSIASVTAPFDPGSEINTLPRAVPAAARLMIAAEPMSRKLK